MLSPLPTPSMTDLHDESTTADPLLGVTLDGRYQVLRVLGEGGLGRVYVATDLRLERPVALKVLLARHASTKSLRARFDREAKALSALSHPNIVTITDYGVDEGRAFVVMELLEGNDLSALLSEERPDPARAIAMTRAILSALAYAHARQIIHRDLKPSNIFVRPLPDGTDHVTVLDFGLAKFLDDGPEKAKEADVQTRAGAMLGTPAYMSPEQSCGEPADARSDVYGAGLILYEMLVGRRPFAEAEGAELLRLRLTTPIPPLHQMDSSLSGQPLLESLVARALAQEPSFRFADAGEMLRAIDELATPSGVFNLPAAAPETAVGGPATRVLGPRATAANRSAAQSGAQSGAGPATVNLAPSKPLATAPTAYADVAPVSRAEISGVPGQALSSQAMQVHSQSGVSSAGQSVGNPSPFDHPHASQSMAGNASMAESPDSRLLLFLAIGVGAFFVLGLIIMVAVVAFSRGDDDEAVTADSTTTAAPNDSHEEPPEVEPPTAGRDRPPARDPFEARDLDPSIRTVLDLLDRGRTPRRSSLRTLGTYATRHPRDAASRLVLARAYAQNGWLGDALEQLEDGLDLDASARGGRGVLEVAVMLAESRTYADRGAAIIRRYYGEEAIPGLRDRIENGQELRGSERERLQTLLDSL